MERYEHNLPKGENYISESNISKYELKKTIDEIQKFDTHGYSKYDTEGFSHFIEKNKINLRDLFEDYLTVLIGNKNDCKDDILNQYKFNSALRVWLQSQDKAMDYIEEQFNYNVLDNNDFFKKYKFLSFVSFLIFENEDPYLETTALNKESGVIKKLDNSVNKDEGSFLLNYSARDLIKVSNEEKVSMKECFDYVPFEISPEVFAFDTKSVFVMTLKNNLKTEGLYVSNKEHYDVIKKVLEKYKSDEFLSQEDFDSIKMFFEPMHPVTNSRLDEEIYRELKDPYHRQKLEEETGISLNKYSIKEQFYFLDFIKMSNHEKVKRVAKSKVIMNDSFMKSFLSLEHGGVEMGDKILELAEKLPENVAKKVFEKYSEIVDATEEVSRYVFDKVKSEGESENLPTEQIKETLLKRGKDLLVSFNEQVRTCTEDECFEIGEKILEELMMIKKEVLLFASTFKALAKERGTKLGDLQDVSINITKDPEFIAKYKDQMEKIFLFNRKDYPQDLKNSGIEEFRDAMDNLDNREVYILKEREDVVAFMRFDQLPNGNLYAGSLNSRSEIKGMAVGGAMLREVLDEKAKTHNVEAMVYEKNPMFNRYISDEYKFEIIGEVEDYRGTGQKMYKLLRRSEVCIPENLPT